MESRSSHADESEVGLMLDAIMAALESRSDLLGWTVRHITTRGAQLYSVPDGVECVRSTDNERYLVDVLPRHVSGKQGKRRRR